MQLWMIHNNVPVGSKIKHPGTVLVFLYCHIMSCMSQLNRELWRLDHVFGSINK